MPKRKVRTRRSAAPEQQVEEVNANSDSLVGNLTSEAMYLLRTIKESQVRMAAIHEEVFTLMARAGLKQVVNESHEVAEMFTPIGRAATYIDPKDFWDKFPEEYKDDFFGAVKVNITAAREVLPSKTVTKIAQVTSAPEKPPEIRFYKMGQKK